jgi:SlyX protein
MSTDMHLMDLEQRLAFQEDALLKLSDQLALQDRDLLNLRTEMRHLHDRLQDALFALEQQSKAAPTERPPHY